MFFKNMNILRLRQFAQTKRGEEIIIVTAYVLTWTFWIIAGYVLASYYHFPVVKYVVA